MNTAVQSSITMMQLYIITAAVFITATAGADFSKRDISSFSQWLQNSGVQMHDKIQWKDNGLNDYGLVLTSSVPRGTVLLKVPRKLVLDSHVIRESFSDEVCKSVVEALGKFHVHEENYWIVWRLYQLKCSGDDNTFASSWINAMPQKFETFTKDEIECLPFYARYAAEYQEAKFASFCIAAGEMKDDCPFDPTNGDHVSLLKWAFNAANSRFWKTNPSENAKIIKQTSELVPLGDMFNHWDPPNVQMIPEDSDYVTFAYKGDDDDDDNQGADGDVSANTFAAFVHIMSCDSHPTYIVLHYWIA